MKDLHSDISAQKDGNIDADAILMPNTKGKNNGSIELPENHHDPDTEPAENKKNHCHKRTRRRLSSTVAESGPMTGNVATREEGTGKNADSDREPSIRLLPTHSITSTCIHPPPPSAPHTSTTNTPTPVRRIVLPGNQLHKETQNDSHEAPTKQKDNATTTNPASENSSHAGQEQQGKADETRERNRILARRRRQRKKNANETTKERIDQVSKANELLRSKNQALIRELVSLGVDERTVMGRIDPIPPDSRKTSDTNGDDDHHHTIEVPRNNQSAELTSIQHQIHQQQHLQQHQQHPNQHYQNLLSAFLGRTNTGGNNAFLQSAAAGDPPPSQLSSPSPLLLPHHHHQQHQQHQQSFHSSIHAAGQQHIWQQQQAMLLGSASTNGQQNAPIMATSARSRTNPASNLGHHVPQDTAPPVESSLGSSGFTGSVTAAEALLASYRRAIMVSQEVEKRLSRSYYFCESSITSRTSIQTLILSHIYCQEAFN